MDLPAMKPAHSSRYELAVSGGGAGCGTVKVFVSVPTTPGGRCGAGRQAAPLCFSSALLGQKKKVSRQVTVTCRVLGAEGALASF